MVLAFLKQNERNATSSARLKFLESDFYSFAFFFSSSIRAEIVELATLERRELRGTKRKGLRNPSQYT